MRVGWRIFHGFFGVVATAKSAEIAWYWWHSLGEPSGLWAWAFIGAGWFGARELERAFTGKYEEAN